MGMRLRTLFDRYALIIAMLIGAVGYQWFRHLDECMPTLIFLMLFFTFCKINPLDLRLRAWHAIVLGCQLALTAGIYYGLHYGLQLVANTWGLTHTDIEVMKQGIMVCVIMPTATAAPIIAGKLGGSACIFPYCESVSPYRIPARDVAYPVSRRSDATGSLHRSMDTASQLRGLSPSQRSTTHLHPIQDMGFHALLPMGVAADSADSQNHPYTVGGRLYGLLNRCIVCGCTRHLYPAVCIGTMDRLSLPCFESRRRLLRCAHQPRRSRL